MTSTSSLSDIAHAIVADGKGILAADETPGTITKRLVARGIESTPDSRRAYRELLFTTPGIVEFIGGVIMQDETISQISSTGVPLVEVITDRGIIPGIKVDAGAQPLAAAPGEKVTEGLDGLRKRLEHYADLGARFAKWRGVFSIDDARPSQRAIEVNAHALARYAALCQEQGVVPIVEPEVLMTGAHGLGRCEEVTGRVLHAVFDALFAQGVALDGMLLKPNMIVAGQDAPEQPSPEEIAEATVRTLARFVPPAVPGVVFLSGGQSHVQATVNLNAILELDAVKPWALTYSYGRALQDEAMSIWLGRSENVAAAQLAFYHRALCASAAAQGRYRTEMESQTAFAQGAGIQLIEHHTQQ